MEILREIRDMENKIRSLNMYLRGVLERGWWDLGIVYVCRDNVWNFFRMEGRYECCDLKIFLSFR